MEQLKKDIKNWLEGHGFTFHEADENTPACWYKMWWVQSPQVLVINGERQESPPMQVAIAFNYDDEPGWTSNPDGSNRVEFLQGTWMIMQGGIENKQYHMDTIFCIEDLANVMMMFGVR